MTSIYSIYEDSPVAAAIDENDGLHIAYIYSSGETIRYVFYDTTNDSLGSEEIDSSGESGDSIGSLSIAVDSNNKPHIAWVMSNVYNNDSSVLYIDKTLGDWGSAVTIDYLTGTELFYGIDITIDEDDLPEVVYYKY